MLSGSAGLLKELHLFNVRSTTVLAAQMFIHQLQLKAATNEIYSLPPHATFTRQAELPHKNLK